MMDEKWLKIFERKMSGKDKYYPLYVKIEEGGWFYIAYMIKLGEWVRSYFQLNKNDQTTVIYSHTRYSGPGEELKNITKGDKLRSPFKRVSEWVEGVDGWRGNLVISEANFLKVVDKLKANADKQFNSDKVYTQKDPSNGVQVWKGTRHIGDVWKGMDRKWHHSEKSIEYAGFRTKAEAMEDLLKPPSERHLDYQPFDSQPRIGSAKQLLQEVRAIKASLRKS